MAGYIYYNANPAGKHEEDCVVRAITLASGLPYEEVEHQLWFTGELLECVPLCRFCYSHLLTNVLKYEPVYCENMTIDEFAETHPFGTYLIRIDSHLTVIIDEILYDIFDCRDELCDLAWKVE